MYLEAKRCDSAPYGSDFSVALLAVLGALIPTTPQRKSSQANEANIPARTKVTLVFSFGMKSLNLDPAETKST
jgi:hypothetical protein